VKETGTRSLGLTAELRDPLMRDLPGWLDEIAVLGLDHAGTRKQLLTRGRGCRS
jgi:hypothetical protein